MTPKPSPLGLFALHEGKAGEHSEQRAERLIAQWEDWAKSILDKSDIKAHPPNAAWLASKREKADAEFFALTVIAKARQMRALLKFNNPDFFYSVMEFCAAGCAGFVVQNEKAIHTRINNLDNLKKASGKRGTLATPELAKAAKRLKDRTPHGGWTEAKLKLAEDSGVSTRTIERLTSKKQK